MGFCGTRAPTLCCSRIRRRRSEGSLPAVVRCAALPSCRGRNVDSDLRCGPGADRSSSRDGLLAVVEPGGRLGVKVGFGEVVFGASVFVFDAVVLGTVGFRTEGVFATDFGAVFGIVGFVTVWRMSRSLVSGDLGRSAFATGGLLNVGCGGRVCGNLACGRTGFDV